MTQEPFDTSSHAELGLMQGFPPPRDKCVTRENGLWDAPYNRWAYQNMRRLAPSAPIRPATQAIDLPRRIDDSLARVTVRRPDRTQADMATFLRQTFTDSLTVVHGGAVVAEHMANGMTPGTAHILFSCTKSFVGLFGLMAVQDGLIAETTPAAQALPALARSGAAAGASFGHLLDMTNSMDFNEDYADEAADIRTYAAITGLAGSGAPQEMTLYDYLLTLGAEPDLAHGAAFRYQTPKADMVDWVTANLTGRGLVDALSDLLWARLGTDADAYLMVDPFGTPVAGGGLCAAPRDVARFCAMMLAGGRFGGAQVVPEAVIDTLRKGGSRQAFLDGGEAEGSMADGTWSYRAQWWVRGTPGREAIMALGIYGQWIYLDLDRDVAIIKTSSQPVASTLYFDEYTLAGMDAIVDHLARR